MAIVHLLIFIALPYMVARALAFPLKVFPPIIHLTAVAILTIIGWFLAIFNH